MAQLGENAGHVLKVPENVVKLYGVSAIQTAGNSVDVIGPNQNKVGTFSISRAGAGFDVKLTRADGHVSDTKYQAVRAANGDITVSGTYNGDAFELTLSAEGKVLQQSPQES